MSLSTYIVTMKLVSVHQGQIEPFAQIAFDARFTATISQSWTNRAVSVEAGQPEEELQRLLPELHKIIAADCGYYFKLDTGATNTNSLEAFSIWNSSGSTHEGEGIVQDATNEWIYYTSQGGNQYRMKARVIF